MAVSVAAVVVPAVAAPSNPKGTAPGTTSQGCGGTSWVAGSTTICDGRVVYRDYVYDDEGADSGDIGYGENTQNAFGTLAHPAGDQRYPKGDINSADLVRLTLTRSGDSVLVSAEMNALFHPRSTILAIAVDSDGDPATGGGQWGDLGVRSDGWDRLYTFSTGDPASNLITGSFQLPHARTWRVQAVTAQAATHTVMNVAFRGIDEGASYNLDYANPSPNPPSARGAWFEDKQSAALSGGDISAFGYQVHTADLHPGVQRDQPVGPGLHERVYTSRYTLPPGEGMSYDGIPGRGDGGSVSAFAQVFNFLGKYQPYGIYIPHHGGPHGLQMEWHGSNQGIVAQINQPGMQQRFGEDLNRLLVVPEARGPNGYGSDISERDLLDVMDDVQAHYAVDRTRVFSSGYSQGGYITYRMAMLYPDRFAGFTSWVGFTGDDANGTPLRGSVGVKAGAVGNMIDYVGNLRHVPGSMLFSAEDELVQVPSAYAMQQAFAATDDVYIWYMHTPADHFTYALADDWAKEAAYSKDQRLVEHPVRVTFRTDPVLDAPKYGIRHDRAYWVSQIRTRGEGAGTVDLATHGCGGAAPVVTEDHGAGVDPVPWLSISQSVSVQRHVAEGPALTGSLTNVRSVLVDVRSACLQGRPVLLDLRTDGPTRLRFSDGRVVDLATAGRHQLVVR